MDSVTQVSLKEIWALTVDSARKSPGRYLAAILSYLELWNSCMYDPIWGRAHIGGTVVLCCLLVQYEGWSSFTVCNLLWLKITSWNFIVSHVHYFCTIAGSSLYFYNVVQLVCLHNMIYVSGCMHSLDWNSQRQKSERDCIHRKCKYKKNNAQYMSCVVHMLACHR